MARDGKRFGRQTLFVYFGQYGTPGTKLLFKDEVFSIQKVETYFYFSTLVRDQVVHGGPTFNYKLSLLIVWVVNELEDSFVRTS